MQLKQLLFSRITVIWLGLVGASCVSLELFRGVPGADLSRIGGGAVLVIAFTKCRYILLDFMELRDAPRPMRLFAELWCAGLGAFLVAALGTSWFGFGAA